MFQFFTKNKLNLTNQSGFKPWDSSINKLLSITHDIYKSFDEGYEVRGVFLDILKAFDNAWHDPIIFKIKQNGIRGRGLFWVDKFPTRQMLPQEFPKGPF